MFHTLHLVMLINVEANWITDCCCGHESSSSALYNKPVHSLPKTVVVNSFLASVLTNNQTTVANPALVLLQHHPRNYWGVVQGASHCP